MYLQISKDIKIYYEIHGSNDAPIKLLLVMGWITTHKAWGKLLAYFATHTQYQCCVFDNRGIGWSSVPSGIYNMTDMATDAIALADHIGWQKFHLVGASMGGMISLRMAAVIPDRLLSLVLLASRHVGGLTLPTWWALWTILKMQFAPRTPESQLGYLVSLFYPPRFLELPHTDSDTNSQPVSQQQQQQQEQQQQQQQEEITTTTTVTSSLLQVVSTKRQFLVKQMIGRQEGVPKTTFKGLIGQLGAIYYHGLSEDEMGVIKHAGFKILLITGDDDYMIPHIHSLNMKKYFGDVAELVVLKGAGHGILEQCEPEIKAKLHEFYSSL
jgi:pimeloyl-ACP methyl ester carboxylesterase